jgi:hypothetical protein
LEFFMNKASSHLISSNCRSAGLAGVFAVLAETNSSTPRQRHNQEKLSAPISTAIRWPFLLYPGAMRCRAAP